MVLGTLVGIAFACLAFLFCLVAPIAILAETFDLIVMDAQTTGVVKNVEIVSGGKGTSAARITYEFVHNGVQYESKRTFPGFWGNSGTYTGGAGLAQKFPVGKQSLVYFDSGNPTRCALEFGWHKWSVGLTAIVWGVIAMCYFSDRKSYLFLLSASFVAYGFGLILIVPFAIKPHEMHWHALAFGATIVWVWLVFRKEIQTQ